MQGALSNALESMSEAKTQLKKKVKERKRRFMDSGDTTSETEEAEVENVLSCVIRKALEARRPGAQTRRRRSTGK